MRCRAWQTKYVIIIFLYKSQILIPSFQASLYVNHQLLSSSITTFYPLVLFSIFIDRGLPYLVSEKNRDTKFKGRKGNREREREREREKLLGGPITELKNFRTNRADLFPIQRIVFRGFSKNRRPTPHTEAKLLIGISFPTGHPSTVTTPPYAAARPTIMARNRSKNTPWSLFESFSAITTTCFSSVRSTSWSIHLENCCFTIDNKA